MQELCPNNPRNGLHFFVGFADLFAKAFKILMLFTYQMKLDSILMAILIAKISPIWSQEIPQELKKSDLQIEKIGVRSESEK